MNHVLCTNHACSSWQMTCIETREATSITFLIIRRWRRWCKKLFTCCLDCISFLDNFTPIYSDNLFHFLCCLARSFSFSGNLLMHVHLATYIFHVNKKARTPLFLLSVLVFTVVCDQVQHALLSFQMSHALNAWPEEKKKKSQICTLEIFLFLLYPIA